MSASPQPPRLRNRDGFLAAFGIGAGTYKKSRLDWKELTEIYADYLKWVPALEAEGKPFLDKLLSHEQVRAVYARAKDPDHLIPTSAHCTTLACVDGRWRVNASTAS